METGRSSQLTLDQIITNQSYTPSFTEIFPKVKPLLIMVNQSLEEAIPMAKDFFETIFGALPGEGAADDAMKYFWRIFSIGDLTRLELMEPTGDGSFLDNFLASKKSGGAHHITLETPDIDKFKKHLEAHDVPYFGYAELGDAWKELYIHPKDAFGILIQVAQMSDPDEYLGDAARHQGPQSPAVAVEVPTSEPAESPHSDREKEAEYHIVLADSSFLPYLDPAHQPAQECKGMDPCLRDQGEEWYLGVPLPAGDAEQPRAAAAQLPHQ